jgi:hypothetical protein
VLAGKLLLHGHMTTVAKPERPFVPLTAEQEESAEAALRDLLAADTVLPEQFWKASPPCGRLSGEVALMWAVFADGIDCFRRNIGAKSLQGRIDLEEAEAWIFATDWDWPFSFVNLCEVFGFDPSAVRWTLQLLKQGQRSVRRHRFRPVTRHAA